MAADPTSTWHLLANTVNAFLNGDADFDAPSFPAVQSAIEYLASAVALEITPGAQTSSSAGVSSAYVRLRSRSERVIHQSAASPSFTVAALADQLGVSRSYLARAYIGTGSTPSERIRAVRLELAAGASSNEDNASRATLAGFTSTRALKRAIRAAAQDLSAAG